MPRAIDPWRKRFAEWQALLQNKQLKATLRRHSPLPHHAETIAAACKQLGLDPDDKNVLLVALSDIIVGTSWNGLLSGKPKAKSGRPKEHDAKWLTSFRRDIMHAAGDDHDIRVATLLHRLRKPKKYGPFRLDYSKFVDSTLKTYLTQALSIKNQELN